MCMAIKSSALNSTVFEHCVVASSQFSGKAATLVMLLSAPLHSQCEAELTRELLPKYTFGASQLIVDGKVRVEQSLDSIKSFETNALVLADSRSLSTNIIVSNSQLLCFHPSVRCATDSPQDSSNSRLTDRARSTFSALRVWR